jgi:hypothetical protein
MFTNPKFTSLLPRNYRTNDQSSSYYVSNWILSIKFASKFIIFILFYFLKEGVGIAMETVSSNNNTNSPAANTMLPPRSARKRNATQAEVNFEQMFSLSDEVVIEAAVAVVFLMINSSQMQVSLLLKSLHRNDLNDFNEAVSSVINGQQQAHST